MKVDLSDRLSQLELDEALYNGEKIEDAIQIAEEANCDVVMGEPNILLLDYDRPSPPPQYYRMVMLLQKLFGVCSIHRWTSRGGNCHMQIKLWSANLDSAERIALQAAMGSDPVKEMIALSRGKLKIRQEPTILFRPKGAKVEVLVKEPEPLTDFDGAL